MTELVPNCKKYVLADAGNTQDHFNALHDFFDNDAIHWTLVDTDESGGNVSAFLIEQGDQQATLTLSGGIISCILDPQGTKTLVDEAASPKASPSVGLVRNATYANTGIIAEYPDAMFFALPNSSQTFWQDAGHFGVIGQAPRSNDASLGITGHGVLGYSPNINSSTATNSWLSITTSIQSRIRIGDEEWVRASADRTSTSSGKGGLLDGKMRFPPVNIRSQGSISSNTNDEVEIMQTKYLASANANHGFRVFSPAATSDQAWLFLPFSSSTVHAVMLWNKTVAP
jgi:hypothetical protein